MGLLKKIRKRPSLRSLCRRRKNTDASKAQTAACKEYDNDDRSSQHLFGEDIIDNETQSTSNPKEGLYFNWLTKQMDDFEVPGCASSSDDSASYNKCHNKHDECNGGWILMILSACLGSSYNKTTEDEPTYYMSTTTSNDHDEEENDDDVESVSSQHSMSRINQVLELPASANDDISDITSTASIDGSASSESESEEGGDDRSIEISATQSTILRTPSLVC